ncbi:hypothetical protein SYJ56_06690 [Algoriphagus sp. D3-2-R+10]|uniref:hypothetical protein n=1 Tax=Algoriphagus aurantiacus TaxID=3103948 RepID=UPI002B38CB91|nr:hypothetical protein [Algoriphagus sp. D3-2-R+10]MEB2774985.1 hypothetical protein [Algoriphagus sp. D3-2-R+10]
MLESLNEFFTLSNFLNVFLYSFGVWIPVYLTHWYHLRGERKKEKSFNKNTLVLLDQELAMIRKSNEKIRKSCHRITDACKRENRLIFDEFPHRLDTEILESLISNLVQFRDQNPMLLRYLIGLKSNLLETNESLDFGLLRTFVENNQRNNAGDTIEGYFEGVLKYIEANFEFIENAKIELGKIE